MFLEISLIIIIIIVVVCEFLKYAILPYFDKEDIRKRCVMQRESFRANEMFKKRINDSDYHNQFS
jgi:hypothetical protein